ncbi:Solute carrier family 22 member 12 [Clarias magur]|uniref:Solute carrier family 22 member 12 n=1 Tax=Clarias magur TaxID=1594786 RepID=A0A8J4TCU5_CLAMG|nr:Solute carrier family 22 member 12 [Clarias magur]
MPGGTIQGRLHGCLSGTHFTCFDTKPTENPAQCHGCNRYAAQLIEGNPESASMQDPDTQPRHMHYACHDGSSPSAPHSLIHSVQAELRLVCSHTELGGCSAAPRCPPAHADKQSNTIRRQNRKPRANLQNSFAPRNHSSSRSVGTQSSFR